MFRKIFLGLGVTILILGISIFAIDMVSVYTLGKPVFAKKITSDDQINTIYKGIFFDTYNCIEYSVPQIKVKGVKFACTYGRDSLGKIEKIEDKTLNMPNYSCAEALEEFYSDDTYSYFYSCMKGNYVTVKYESGFEESVAQALKYKTITIDDLDEYNIKYIKHQKINNGDK